MTLLAIVLVVVALSAMCTSVVVCVYVRAVCDVVRRAVLR